MTRTPSITQPPFDRLPPATYDETAPRGGPIMCDNPPPQMRRIMRLAVMRLGNTRLRTGLVSPDDLQQEMAAFYER